MLRHGADCADSQGAGRQDKPKVPGAHSLAEFHTLGAARPSSGRRTSIVRGKPHRCPQGTIGEKIHLARIRTCYPLRDWEQYDQDQYSNNLKSVTPAKTLNQRVNQKRRNCATQAQSEIRIAHRAASSDVKPVGYQHLIGNRAGQNVADNLCHTEHVVLPQARHTPHQDQGDTNKPYADANHAPGAPPVNQYARQDSEEQRRHHETNQEALG